MAYPPASPATDLENGTLTEDTHPDHHNELGQAIIDIVAELGANPSGSESTVQDRIAAIEGTGDAAAIHDNVAGEINAITAKATPVGADLALIEDSAASFAKKKIALSALAALYQPLDSDLTAIAALTTTAYGRAFLELANQAALMALLSAATTSASGIVEQATTAEAQGGTDDSRYITALGRLASAEVRIVRVASGSNVTIATALNPGDAIDGVTLAQDDLVLLTGQTSSIDNGIYRVDASPARSAAMATGMSVKPGTMVVVNEGTIGVDAVFMLTTNGSIVVGTNGMTWTNLRTTLGAQPLDSDLTAIAALTTTSYGRAFLELANQAALMALLSSATTSAEGKVELATETEAYTGTDTSRAVTPAGVFQAIAIRTINAQSGTSYTLVLGDAGKMVTLNNASPITLTVPANSSVAFVVGTQIELAQLGAGQVTVAAAGGVTIRSTDTLKLTDQYSAVVLTKLATDEWLMTGRIATS